MKALPVLEPLCCGPDTPVMSAGAASDLAATFKALGLALREAMAPGGAPGAPSSKGLLG